MKTPRQTARALGALLAVTVLQTVAMESAYFALRALEPEMSWEATYTRVGAASLTGALVAGVLGTFVGAQATLFVSLLLGLLATLVLGTGAYVSALLLVGTAQGSILVALAALAVHFGRLRGSVMAWMVAVQAAVNVGLLLESEVSPTEPLPIPTAALLMAAAMAVLLMGRTGPAPVPPVPVRFHWPTLVTVPLIGGAAGAQFAVSRLGTTFLIEHLGWRAARPLFELQAISVAVSAIPFAVFALWANRRGRPVRAGLLAAVGLLISAAAAGTLFITDEVAFAFGFVVCSAVGEVLVFPALWALVTSGQPWKTVTAVLAGAICIRTAYFLALLSGGERVPLGGGVLGSSALVVLAATALLVLERFRPGWLVPDA